MRLKQHLGAGEIEFVDVRQPKALDRVVAARPNTIIVDAGDTSLEAQCPLNKLLDALPALRIIRLDAQQEQVQVVTSERKSAPHVSDLVSVINAGLTGETESNEE